MNIEQEQCRVLTYLRSPRPVLMATVTAIAKGTELPEDEVIECLRVLERDGEVRVNGEGEQAVWSST